jgi:hypothetical protein
VGDVNGGQYFPEESERMSPSGTEQKVAAVVERIDGLRRETELRYKALGEVTEQRHVENRDLLQKIFEQTRKTNGDVVDLKAWRDAHEEITCERLEAIDKRFADVYLKVDDRYKDINTKAETAKIALELLNAERLRRQGEAQMLRWLWAPISALVGAAASHFFPIIEKALGFGK